MARDWLTVAKVRPSGEKEMLVGGAPWGRIGGSRSRPDGISQNRMEPSLPPVARSLPSGERDILQTSDCPEKTSRRRSVEMSQTPIFPPGLMPTRVLPSG